MFEHEKIKFGLLISFQIPSIICHLFVIYHLIVDSRLRKSLRHNVFLIFLSINFLLITLDLSITLHFLRRSSFDEHDYQLCVGWNFLDSFLVSLCTLLIVWISFERYLLIFYDRIFFNTRKKRLIVHYCPFIVLFIYSFCFYFYAVFMNLSCQNAEHFDFDEIFCGRACFVHADKIVSSIDLLFNKIVCSILILIFNFLLLIRVIYQKRRRNQAMNWNRHRKIAIQVLSISLLYLIGVLPAAIAEVFHIFELNPHEEGSEEESIIQENVFLYLFYFISLIIPFICLMSLPKIYRKIPFLSRLIRFNRVHTEATFSVRRNQVGIIN